MLMANYRIIKNGKARKVKSEVSNPFWGIIFRHLAQLKKKKRKKKAQFFKIRMLRNMLETIY